MKTLAKIGLGICIMLMLGSVALVAEEPPQFLTKWGSYGTGDGQFNTPVDIAVDPNAGNVYVVDHYNNRIQKFTSDGEFIRKWGSFGSGDGQFERPYGIAVGPNGNIYVTESHNQRVQKFTSDGVLIGWWGRDNTGYTGWHDPGSGRWGITGSGDGQFRWPAGIAVDPNDGSVYVADNWNERVQKFTSDGVFLTKWGSYGYGDGQFRTPTHIAVDPNDGSVYVADTYNHRIQKFTSNGVLIGWWGKDNTGYTGWHDPGSGRWGITGSCDGQFGRQFWYDGPFGVAVDSKGNVCVADLSNNRIQKFTSDGGFITKWGSDGSGDGQFRSPIDIAVDADGNLYVTDSGNHRIQKFGKPTIEVDVDIKPESCPNPLNPKSKGVLPVAILGTEEFDVNDIDPASVRLEGVEPLRSALEDVSRPVSEPEDECDCTTDGPDGFLDLTLKFDTQKIVEALEVREGELVHGHEYELTLIGSLIDDTEIQGVDCVVIKGKGGPKSAGVGSSSPMVFALSQNNPNPFARETSISYTLPASGYTTLKVYDTSGRLVTTLINAEMNAGVYSTGWNRKDAASGVYFYRLTNNGNSVTRKMTVLR